MSFTFKVLAFVGMTALTSGPLSDYNLVLFGDLNASGNVHVDGTAFVGGNFRNGTDFANHLDVSYNTQATLEVGGNITVNSLSLQQGYLAHGGSISGNVNCNGANLSGGRCVTQVAGLAAKGVNLYDQLRAESLFYADLASLGSASAGTAINGDMNNKTFSYTGGATDLAVFNISGDELFAVGGWGLSLGNAQRAVINVTGSTINQANRSVNMNINYSNAGNLLWNFYDATTINFKNNWVGSVLATEAVIDTYNNFNGAVAAQSYIGRGEFHRYQWDFNPPLPATTPPSEVPEPSLLLLLLSGIGLVCMGRLRRR
jgi:choice-of-anchor A domain-containing protein